MNKILLTSFIIVMNFSCSLFASEVLTTEELLFNRLRVMLTDPSATTIPVDSESGETLFLQPVSVVHPEFWHETRKIKETETVKILSILLPRHRCMLQNICNSEASITSHSFVLDDILIFEIEDPESKESVCFSFDHDFYGPTSDLIQCLKDDADIYICPLTGTQFEIDRYFNFTLKKSTNYCLQPFPHKNDDEPFKYMIYNGMDFAGMCSLKKINSIEPNVEDFYSSEEINPEILCENSLLNRNLLLLLMQNT